MSTRSSSDQIEEAQEAFQMSSLSALLLAMFPTFGWRVPTFIDSQHHDALIGSAIAESKKVRRCMCRSRCMDSPHMLEFLSLEQATENMERVPDLVRLDSLLIERGLCGNRAQARLVIKKGCVKVEAIHKKGLTPALLLEDDHPIELISLQEVAQASFREEEEEGTEEEVAKFNRSEKNIFDKDWAEIERKAALEAEQLDRFVTALEDLEEDWSALLEEQEDWAIIDQIRFAKTAEALLQIMEKNVESFTDHTLVAETLKQFASVVKRGDAQAFKRGDAQTFTARRDYVIYDQRFLALAQRAIDLLPECDERSCSLIIWAFATLRCEVPAQMLQPLLRQILKQLRLGRFDSRQLSIVAWSLGELRLKPVIVLEKIEREALKQIQTFGQQDCNYILSGFNKLGYQPRALLADMTAKISDPSYIACMNVAEVTQTSFALAALGTAEKQGPVIRAIAKRVTPKDMLPRFGMSFLVTLICANAKFRLRPAHLEWWVYRLKQLVLQEPMKPDDRGPLEEALLRFKMDTRWLYEKPLNDQINKATTVQELFQITETSVGFFNAERVVNTLCKLAIAVRWSEDRPVQRSYILNDDCFYALAERAYVVLNECDAPSISKIMWSFANLRYIPSDLQFSLLSRIQAQLKAREFSAKEISVIAWSLVYTDVFQAASEMRLLEDIEEAALEQVSEFGRIACNNLLWAFAKLAYEPYELLPVITTRILEPEFVAGVTVIEIVGMCYALAAMGTYTLQGPVLLAFARRITPDDLLPAFKISQLVTVIWSFGKLGLVPEQLDTWIERLQELIFVKKQPIGRKDLVDLESALLRLKANYEWLSPAIEEYGREFSDYGGVSNFGGVRGVPKSVSQFEI